MDRDSVLSLQFGLFCQDKKFFYARITQRYASNGNAFPVNKYIAAGFLRIAFDTVGFIGIIQTQGKVELTFGIKTVNMVDAFRNLLVPFFSFWP